MMNDLGKEKKLDSNIFGKIRKAGFVNEPSSASEKFKYLFLQHSIKYISNKLINTKRYINSALQKGNKWFGFIKWKKASKDFSIWFLEVLIEGATINYAAHFLVGFKFDLFISIAFGIAMKKFIEVYLKLKTHGEHKSVPNR